MNIQFFCPRWGQTDLPWSTFARKVKEAGYDGVETDIPEEEAALSDLLSALKENHLQLIAQHWETTDPVFSTHLTAYTRRLRRMAAVQPLFINSQTGRDFFTTEQNEILLSVAAEITTTTNIPVYHETHRGKFSFAAHITQKFLEQNPTLLLTLDLSHWFAVAETFLQDQPQAVELALARTRHIHARVGYTQGPQVPDPRTPEWREALQTHLACWDKIVATHRQTNQPLLTIAPEFGPPPYMLLLPGTNKPVADQWDLNIFILQLLKERYK